MTRGAALQRALPMQSTMGSTGARRSEERNRRRPHMLHVEDRAPTPPATPPSDAVEESNRCRSRAGCVGLFSGGRLGRSRDRMQRAANDMSMSGMQAPWPFPGSGAETSRAPSRISTRAPQGRRTVTGASLRNRRPGRPAQVGPMSLGRMPARVAPLPGPKPWWKSRVLVLVPALILLVVLFPADSASAQTRPR